MIVPVYNNNAGLRTCLAALEDQTYPADRYEVIAIDNGSDQPVASAAPFPHVRVVTESRPGSYAARNRGIDVARGDVIAFTDSDCIPANTWIAHGVTALLGTPHCGLVGGHIEVFYAMPSRPTAIERFSAMTARQQQLFIETNHFAETANLFTFKAVLEQVGRFDQALKARGDVVFGRRVFAAGYRQIYAENARVRHPATRTLHELRRRTARLVGGKRDAARSQSSASFAVTDTASIDPRHVLRLARRLLRHAEFAPSERCAVLGVLGFVQAVACVERVRLLLGGTSRR
ncbi:MAG TPA: glycosyltransferase [Candidatus Methylomirabilis sp.]|nr:glycosyltransferase [Candidatus Methylomirabilis sp.]